MAAGVVLILVVLAFIGEYVDSTVGMGYGTTLTPVLLLIGFEPLQIVPAVLLSELFTGFLAGFTHHAMGNVSLLPKTMRISLIFSRLREVGFVKGVQHGLPIHLKITIIIASCSIVGTVASVCLALRLPQFFLKLYIGALIFVIGIIILLTLNRKFDFSWSRIIGLGILASFNKGISGGGYGPVVTGGQLLAGVDGKNAIGITSLAEGTTCLVGVSVYMASSQVIDWSLAPWLCLGALLSVPFSAWTVKVIKTDKLRVIIGFITLLLGITTLWKVLS
ncbi:MAG: sulfite exporter TauE/SafE family protein [Nitrospirae bacterium]|nr:sulfite exporter TauE/SafE family protein [Nitrospirota bacterium]